MSNDSNYFYIAAIDPGKVNFAFSVEKIDRKKCGNLKTLDDLKGVGETYIMENINLCKGVDKKKYIDSQVFLNLTVVLDKYKEVWDKCDVILIEQQMSFGRNKNNTMALKIAQHCYSYFLIMYARFKTIIEYPSYHKTQVLQAPKKMDKPARKKWSVQKVEQLFKDRNDTKNLEDLTSRKKKDDVSDCVLMNLTYIYQVYCLKKVFV